MNDKNKIKAIIVDDHMVVRDGVEAIICKEEDIDLVGKASNADEAIKLLNDLDIDVAILDISIPGSVSGIDLARAISERFPDVKILMHSMYDESIYAERALQAGAHGYIMKDVNVLNLCEAIRTVMDDEIYLSQELQKKILKKLVKGPGDDKGVSVEVLSNREFEVFQMIGKGFSTKEIADELNISTNTVENHRNHIRTKMDLKNHAALVKYAIQWIIDNSK